MAEVAVIFRAISTSKHAVSQTIQDGEGLQWGVSHHGDEKRTPLRSIGAQMKR